MSTPKRKSQGLTRSQWVLLKGAANGERISFWLGSGRGHDWHWSTPEGSTGNDALTCQRRGWIEKDKSSWKECSYKITEAGQKIIDEATEPIAPETVRLWKYEYGQLRHQDATRKGNSWFGEYGSRIKGGWWQSKAVALNSALRSAESAIEHACAERDSLRRLIAQNAVDSEQDTVSKNGTAPKTKSADSLDYGDGINAAKPDSV